MRLKNAEAAQWHSRCHYITWPPTACVTNWYTANSNTQPQQ